MTTLLMSIVIIIQFILIIILNLKYKEAQQTAASQFSIARLSITKDMMKIAKYDVLEMDLADLKFNLRCTKKELEFIKSAAMQNGEKAEWLYRTLSDFHQSIKL